MSQTKQKSNIIPLRVSCEETCIPLTITELYTPQQEQQDAESDEN